MHRKLKRLYISGCFLCLMFSVSCGEIELYHDLTESDANEILVLLSEHDIQATKKKEVRQNEVSFSIGLPAKEMARARSLLVQHNLPRRMELGLTGVYKEKGLIPTPDEQKARFLLALKGEIINSLERLPQVIDADVVLNIPTPPEFGGTAVDASRRPTASVVIKAQPTATGEGINEAKIQQFVANAVEGLNPRDVAVILSYISVENTLRPGDVRTLSPSTASSGDEEKEALESELLGLKLDEASKDRLKIYLLLFFVLLLILATGLIIAIVQASRTRQRLQALEAGGRAPALEGHVMEEERHLEGEGE